MRQDRSQWLVLFIGISLLIHVGAIYRSRSMPRPAPDAPPPSIEIALQPLPDVKPPVVAQPAPKNLPKPAVHKAPTAPRPDHAIASRVKAIVKAPTIVPAVHEVIKPTRTPLPPQEKPTAKQPDANLGGLAKIRDERPMAIGLPSAHKDSGAPKLDRSPRIASVGGGAPAPSPVAGGHEGAPTPETPPDDLAYNGGGAGGQNLPHTAPRIGGGGGKSILGVEDPLAKLAVPDDKPGIGPGKGGGHGLGAGAGVGAGRGAGVGARPNAGNALSSLHSKPGSGIGAGTGTKIGTNPPGGGHGTGAELPGTGGSGYGYGRGKGIGIGDGIGISSGKGTGSAGSGNERGVPFGDVAGLLNNSGRGGGNNGGPGGAGRGSVFGARPGVGKGVLNVVYVLDCSGSMRDGNKIGKAEEALKKALSELKPTDSFDILSFNGRIYKLSPVMLPASGEVIDAAMLWIDKLRLANHTNISGAMGAALELTPINCVYLMSDGEPEGPETLHNPSEIREYVKQCNTQHARIMTLALCLGEQYAGEQVMRGLAEDAGGDYNYIDLSKVR